MKTKTRLYIGDITINPDVELELTAEQLRYVGKVLRLRAGDELIVFNGDSGAFDATLQTIGRSSASIKTGTRHETATESPLNVHLVQGISRGERMDFVVQKATELGVKRISPVLTERGVVKLDESRAQKRREHWQKVAESACEQSGRIRPPLVDAPMHLKTWLGQKTVNADVDIILRPDAATPLTSIAAPASKICVLIGPEGGFSDGEYDDASAAGFTAASLGPRILRTETAAVTALAVAQSLWGDLGLD